MMHSWEESLTNNFIISVKLLEMKCLTYSSHNILFFFRLPFSWLSSVKVKVFLPLLVQAPVLVMVATGHFSFFYDLDIPHLISMFLFFSLAYLHWKLPLSDLFMLNTQEQIFCDSVDQF